MAFTITDRGASLTTTNADTTSASFTPAAGALLVVKIAAAYASAVTPVLSDTFTGTSAWTLRKTGQAFPTTETAAIWTAVAGGSPGAGTIKITQGGNTGFASVTVQFVEISGQNSSPIGSSGSAFTSAAVQQLAVVMGSAPASSSLVLGSFFNDQGNTATTLPSGWTQLNNIADTANGSRADFSYKNGSAATTVTWTVLGNTAFPCTGVTVEIVLAAAVAFIARPPMVTAQPVPRSATR